MTNPDSLEQDIKWCFRRELKAMRRDTRERFVDDICEAIDSGEQDPVDVTALVTDFYNGAIT